MKTSVWFRAALIGLVFGSGALAPAGAWAQRQEKTLRCSTPLAPDKALGLMRALSKRSIRSGFEQRGLRSGTRMEIGLFSGDASAWKVSAAVKTEFVFAPRGGFAALSSTRNFASFLLDLGYDAASATLVVAATANTPNLFSLPVETGPVTLRDASANRGNTSLTFPVNATRVMLGDAYAAAGQPTDTATLDITLEEEQAPGKRTLTAHGLLPADVRVALQCDAERGVSVGQELLLRAKLELTSKEAFGPQDERVAALELRLNGAVVRAGQSDAQGARPPLGSFRLASDGLGLYSGLVIDPARLGSRPSIGFRHFADLTLGFTANAQPLLPTSQARFEVYCDSATGC